VVEDQKNPFRMESVLEKEPTKEKIVFNPYPFSMK